MRRYWWVNHKQTFRQEIEGGYLWSPKRESSGFRSQFYDNMRHAKPGDKVVSYANTQVHYIGTVTNYAVSAPKPREFETAGSYWNSEGWLLPIEWTKIDTSIRLKDFIEEIRPYLPKKYSPISHKTGGGNQKAYLAEINIDIFSIISREAGFKNSKTPVIDTLLPQLISDIENTALESIENDTTLSRTDRDQVIKARLGQGRFRKNVFQVERCCRITGITNPNLLIASHIKPWRSCTSSVERLDGCNGLLLSPHIDYLFDKGFISFADAGSLLISKTLPNEDAEKLYLFDKARLPAKSFNTKQRTYLKYHRSEVFLSPHANDE